MISRLGQIRIGHGQHPVEGSTHIYKVCIYTLHSRYSIYIYIGSEGNEAMNVEQVLLYHCPRM